MASLERMQILVTAEQKRWLEAESARRGEPVTALVRAAIDGARTHRTRANRLAALEELEALWAQPIERVTDLPVEAIAAMTDEGRLAEAMRGVEP